MTGDLQARFDRLLEALPGFRVDGIPLAKALMDEVSLQRLETLLGEGTGHKAIRAKAQRIEFITDGALPPDQREEPPLKSETVFKQAIGYGLCKACRLCIEVCPKHVYKDDGFGRPSAESRRPEECTGPYQCGQCTDICPEKTIHVVLANPVFKSTLYILIPEASAPAMHASPSPVAAVQDFVVANPLEAGAPVMIPAKLNPTDLKDCHRVLDQARLNLLLELHGYTRMFVDSLDPEKDLRTWAHENGLPPKKVRWALAFLYHQLPNIGLLRQGSYRLDDILQRIIDDIVAQEIPAEGAHARALLAGIVKAARIDEPFLGPKYRPIGGLLPTGTSIVWKTPYGDEIPNYAHLEKCLGPECGLCVTHCPEGGGGKNAAIRMMPKVPWGTMPSLVRGLKTHLLRLDGSHANLDQIEDLTGHSPFEFQVDPDFCKACGICITCCPHDVIEPIGRTLNLRQVAS